MKQMSMSDQEMQEIPEVICTWSTELAERISYIMNSNKNGVGKVPEFWTLNLKITKETMVHEGLATQKAIL